VVMISRMRGEVEVRYVRWVKELKSGRAEVVSRAACAHQGWMGGCVRGDWVGWRK
jgi:hypothetical protein